MICNFVLFFKCYFFSALFWRVRNFFSASLLFWPHDWQASIRWVRKREWYSVLSIWMLAWYLSLLSIPNARLSFIWTCEIWGDLNLDFVLETQHVLFFLYLENVYLLWATLRVFSDHDLFSLLMLPANCLRELCWYNLQSDMPWSIFGISGDHWCMSGIIMDPEQILEALQMQYDQQYE